MYTVTSSWVSKFICIFNILKISACLLAMHQEHFCCPCSITLFWTFTPNTFSGDLLPSVPGCLLYGCILQTTKYQIGEIILVPGLGPLSELVLELCFWALEASDISALGESRPLLHLRAVQEWEPSGRLKLWPSIHRPELKGAVRKRCLQSPIAT